MKLIIHIFKFLNWPVHGVRDTIDQEEKQLVTALVKIDNMCLNSYPFIFPSLSTTCCLL